jgi:hypothetical protein
MQKSLNQMNVRMHRAVSDIERGKRGRPSCERSSTESGTRYRLAKLRDGRCHNHKSEEGVLSPDRATYRGKCGGICHCPETGCHIYRLLRWRQPYVDEGAERYQRRYRENRNRSLTTRAKEPGFQLTPVPA